MRTLVRLFQMIRSLSSRKLLYLAYPVGFYHCFYAYILSYCIRKVQQKYHSLNVLLLVEVVFDSGKKKSWSVLDFTWPCFCWPYLSLNITVILGVKQQWSADCQANLVCVLLLAYNSTLYSNHVMLVFLYFLPSFFQHNIVHTLYFFNIIRSQEPS